MKSLTALSISSLAAVLCFGQDRGEAKGSDLYQVASKQFIAESQDYLQVMKDSLAEMKRWRSGFLTEQFGGRLKKIEKLLFESNSEITKEIEDYVKNVGTDSLDDVLLMRLAQLHYERSSLILNRKMKEYELNLKAFMEGKSKESPKLPEPDYRLTIRYCKMLLKNFPMSSLADKAYYLIAYSLEEMGEAEKSIEAYQFFLKKHPQSPLIDEAIWRLAEYSYDSRKLSEAVKYYLMLIGKNSDFRLKALYKLGACHYEQGDTEKSAKYFRLLYEKTTGMLEVNAENETLSEEAIEYLGILQGMGVDVKLREKDRIEATQHLAQVYKRLSDDQHERVVYANFINKYPYSGVTPQFMDNLVESYTSEDNNDLAGKQRARLVDLLVRDDKWWSYNRGNRNDFFAAEDLLEKHLLATAQNHAEQGIAKNNREQLQLARQQYKRFLKDYPYSNNFLQALFELAEVEYSQGSYQEASQDYLRVVKMSSDSAQKSNAAYQYLWSEMRKVDYKMDEKGIVQVIRLPNGLIAPPVALNEKESAVSDFKS